MAKLVLSLNGVLHNQFFTDLPILRIGRAAENEIVIDDPALVEFHACIRCIGEDHILEDIANSGGILVNGTPVSRQILQHLDTIQLGAYHLRYMNSRVASQTSLDHTMLIEALPGERQTTVTQDTTTADKGTGIFHFPDGYVRVLQGDEQHAKGEIIPLDRVIATFGKPGKQRVVLTRRPQGFFLSLVEGANPPKVNQRSTSGKAVALKNGDVIDAGGCRLEFHLGTP